MPRSKNVVQLGGNVGNDPTLRHTGSGTAVTNFNMATNHYYRSGEETKTEVTWHAITVFGKEAERVVENVRKGDYVLVEGRLANRQWKDKKGVDQRRTEIVAARVEFFTRDEDYEDEDLMGNDPPVELNDMEIEE